MKNTVNYYYNIRIDEFIKKDNNYYFYLNNDEYYLILYDRPIEDINALYSLNKEMIKKRCIAHEIILNKDNSAVTVINNIPYVLIKICKYKNNRVFFNDIAYLQNATYNMNFDEMLYRYDWVKLWADKIDYYEYQISQLGKSYPILCDSLSYYIGLGENAISYLVNNITDNNKILTVSHKRIEFDKGSFEFYNPLNFIIDNRVRDISEYIKNTFFHNQLNEFEIEAFLDYANLSKEEYIYLYSRLLFPTYYFDIYDRIINEKLSEESILPILEKSSLYEKFLFNMYNYIVYKKKVQIEPIEWIMKAYS